MEGKLLLLRSREYNRVQQSYMGWPKEYNTYSIPKNQRNVVSYSICLMKKLDHDQTSYNKIQTSVTFHTTLYDALFMKCCTRLTGALDVGKLVIYGPRDMLKLTKLSYFSKL